MHTGGELFNGELHDIQFELEYLPKFNPLVNYN